MGTTDFCTHTQTHAHTLPLTRQLRNSVIYVFSDKDYIGLVVFSLYFRSGVFWL